MDIINLIFFQSVYNSYNNSCLKKILYWNNDISLKYLFTIFQYFREKSFIANFLKKIKQCFSKKWLYIIPFSINSLCRSLAKNNLLISSTCIKKKISKCQVLEIVGGKKIAHRDIFIWCLSSLQHYWLVLILLYSSIIGTIYLKQLLQCKLIVYYVSYAGCWMKNTQIYIYIVKSLNYLNSSLLHIITQFLIP